MDVESVIRSKEDHDSVRSEMITEQDLGQEEGYSEVFANQVEDIVNVVIKVEDDKTLFFNENEEPGTDWSEDPLNENGPNSATLDYEERAALFGGNDSTEMKLLACADCGQLFKTRSGLTQHTKSHLNLKLFPCTICGKNFTRKYGLNSHHKHQHSSLSPAKKVKTPAKSETAKDDSHDSFSCSICGKTFSRKSYLVTHNQLHLGIKPFACPVCGKTFAQKYNMKDHFKVHLESRPKPFECPDCGKCFARKSDFTDHTKIHLDVKPLECSDCGQRFARKSNLIAHQKVHLGIKSYRCRCGKRFPNEDQLVEHQNQGHSELDLFSCVYCGRLFNRQSNVAKHKRICSQKTNTNI